MAIRGGSGPQGMQECGGTPGTNEGKPREGASNGIQPRGGGKARDLCVTQHCGGALESHGGGLQLRAGASRAESALVLHLQRGALLLLQQLLQLRRA